MYRFLIQLFVFGIFSTAQSESAYENCTSDYEQLEKALMSSRHNIFLLKTILFPPQTENPVYVTVTYNFSTTSVDYIWSTANLYLTIHPHIISYLSLFFSSIEADRVVQLELQLPEECSELTSNTRSDTSNFMFILTHRVMELYVYTHSTFTVLFSFSYTTWFRRIQLC